jgi:Na+-translocating ferredoxin:NAD+ oxidoreductase subunit G
MMRPVVVLAALCLVSALALGLVYQRTEARIQNREILRDDLVRRRVLPAAASGVFVSVRADSFSYYEGYKNADTTALAGYTVRAQGRGYASTIVAIVGVDRAGTITGVKIVSHEETPGLGARIDEVASGRTVLDALRSLVGGESSSGPAGAGRRAEPDPWWPAQFAGKSRGELVVTKERGDRGIQAITGATISSRAVTEAVKGALAELERAICGFEENPQ